MLNKFEKYFSMLLAPGPSGAVRKTYLAQEGIGIIMISHDLHDVFDLSDRVCVMKNGRHVWTGNVTDTTKEEVLQMIILGKLPDGSYAPGIIAEADNSA